MRIEEFYLKESETLIPTRIYLRFDILFFNPVKYLKISSKGMNGNKPNPELGSDLLEGKTSN